MKAGAAIRDITPKAPIQLCGYPESPISTGTHDPFYIAAFYFADAQTKILYLTADLLFFARARVDKITAEISGKTGVAQENILLAATHTHYGLSLIHISRGRSRAILRATSQTMCSLCVSAA